MFGHTDTERTEEVEKVRDNQAASPVEVLLRGFCAVRGSR